MEKIIPVLNDLSVIIFDLLIFTRMISLRREGLLHKLLMYLGCTVIILAYFTAAYILEFPASLASMVCMSIPSLLLFFYLSKYRDSRFILTFCIVDSVTLIVAFLGRYVGVLTGHSGGIVMLVVTVAIFSGITVYGWPYFKQYHVLLGVAKSGWRGMAVSAALIYFALIFSAAYPQPLIDRVEYGPVYMTICLVIISCYYVFVQSILKTHRIIQQNEQLEKEKEIYQMAYMDALTGLYNRASYIEKVNTLERNKKEGEIFWCIVFDVNEFKSINDTYGHQAGDRALQAVADSLRTVFSGNPRYIFRFGGDEFIVIEAEQPEEAIVQKIEDLKQIIAEESESLGFQLTLAAGYDCLWQDKNDTLENVFVRADQKMYENKRKDALKV